MQGGSRKWGLSEPPEPPPLLRTWLIISIPVQSQTCVLTWLIHIIWYLLQSSTSKSRNHLHRAVQVSGAAFTHLQFAAFCATAVLQGVNSTQRPHFPPPVPTQPHPAACLGSISGLVVWLQLGVILSSHADEMHLVLMKCCSHLISLLRNAKSAVLFSLILTNSPQLLVLHYWARHRDGFISLVSRVCVFKESDLFNVNAVCFTQLVLYIR